MKRKLLGAAVCCGLALAACSMTPIRDAAPRVAIVVSAAGPGAPRLPKAGEGYLDPAYFDQALTPERAVQATLLNNPSVRAELTRLDVAQAERVQAGLVSNPIGSLMALRPKDGGRYELDYSLMQSLFDLFSRSRRIAVADAAQQQVEADVVMKLVARVQDTERAYYEALVADARLRILQEQLRLDERSLVLLQRQASVGSISTSAVLEVQAITAMRGHDLRDGEADLAQARASLAQAIGLASAKSLVLPVQFPQWTLSGLDEPALQALAAAHRADLQAASAQVDQAKADRALQTGVLRATEPNLGPAGTRESGGWSLNGLAVQIVLPIFDTGQARRDLANARVAQATYEQVATTRRVSLEVERGLATLAIAQMAIGHADHHLLQQEQLELLARRNYEQGVSDLLRYSQATQARLTSEMQQLAAQQALYSAALELEKATSTDIKPLF